jgi:hypothetical protein
MGFWIGLAFTAGTLLGAYITIVFHELHKDSR